MKNIIYLLIISFTVFSCGLSNTKSSPTSKKELEEAVVISNDSLEYEIIIYDIGFNTYLNTIARPMGYHSQQYLESYNNFYVTEWNIRANSPLIYGDLYGMQIDYSVGIDYGLEVNYKLFNYFKFFEQKYRVRLR